MTEVFEHYYQAMIYSLPMKDASFLDVLNKNDLLPAHIKSALESLDKSIERASYFLDNVIKPELCDSAHACFSKLLTVMIEWGYDNMEDLANKLKSKMPVDCSKQLTGINCHVQSK